MSRVGNAASTRTSVSTAAKPITDAYPPRAYAWYVIAVIVFVTLLSSLDRFLPSLLVEPLRESFGITDTQVGLLQGPAFTIFYCLFGLPFGYLVDRSSRPLLLMSAVTLWSTLTILSGFADSYWQLLIARMGVGIGEACLAPAAYSLISDYFEPKVRGRALGAFYVGVALGGGGSIFLGGLLYRLFPANGIELGFLGHFETWRLLFICAGLPAIIAILLLFTVREVPRKEVVPGVRVPSTEREAGRFLPYALRHRGVFLSILICYSATAFMSAAVMGWAPTFYVRSFHLPIATVGTLVGVAMMVMGVASGLLSGALSDRWVARHSRGGRFRAVVLSHLLSLPLGILWPLMTNLTASIGVFMLFACTLSIGMSSTAAVLQDIVPNRMRGQAVAVVYIAVGLIGLALGPMVPAMLTDYVFRADSALYLSLLVAAGCGGIIGVAAALYGLGPYERLRLAVRELFASAAPDTRLSPEAPLPTVS